MCTRGRRFNPDSTPVPFNNTFAGSQSDPLSRILIARMEAAKYFEDALPMLWIDTDAIVSDRKDPFAILLNGRYLNHRNRPTRRKLDGI